MKKTFFAAAIAVAALVPATIFAQDGDKEYNMVITLQNGTTVTLGHNDIKNITFNGEEIAIDGNIVNTISQNSNEIEQIYMQLEEAKNMISQVLNTSNDGLSDEEVRTMIGQASNALEAKIQEQLDGIALSFEQVVMPTVETVADLKLTVDGSYDGKTLGLKQRIADMEGYVTEEFKANKAAIDEVTASNEELWQFVNGEDNSIMTQISQTLNASKGYTDEAKDVLQNKIIMLMDKIAELEAKIANINGAE